MDEVIKILREQAILSARMPELFDELIKIVQSNSPDVQEVIGKIDTVRRDLDKNQKQAQDFLKQVKSASLTEFIAAQEKSIQRDVAENLLSKAAESQLRLKNQIAELKLLVQRGKDYVAFNLNILAHISASDTYGAAAKTGSRSSRSMFEANV